MKSINDFNKETKEIIEQYIEDLFLMFPNLENKISKKQVETELISNLDHNIEFNCKLKEKTGGKYNTKEKKIYISEKINNDSKQKDLTVFHEISHALTAKLTAYLANYLGSNPYIMEIFVTLMERRYNKMKYNSNDKKINGYIPDFGIQLETICGDNLFEQLISQPDKIHEIFLSDEELKIDYFFDLVDNFQEFKYLLSDVSKDKELRSLVEKIERMISSQFYYLMNSSNMEKFGNIVNSLFEQQNYPDFEMYVTAIKELESNQINLSTYPELQLLLKNYYLQNKNEILENFKNASYHTGITNKERMILSQKLFGFISNDPFDIPPDISEYIKNDDIYIGIMHWLCDDNKIESLDDILYRRCSDSYRKIADYLNEDEVEKFKHFSDEVNINALYALYNDKQQEIMIFDEGGLEYKKINIFEEILKLPKSEFMEKIKSFVLDVIQLNLL